ncbi:MAG: hypothetical protein NVSMB29_17910 [Candidatus Dormibacteria bacterium]
MESTVADVLTVREAARRVGRTPETVRRWVWSGRLTATKRGNRLLVTRADLERVAGAGQRPALATWLEALDLRTRPSGVPGAGSAADLVLEDRRDRSAEEGRHARR